MSRRVVVTILVHIPAISASVRMEIALLLLVADSQAGVYICIHSHNFYIQSYMEEHLLVISLLRRTNKVSYIPKVDQTFQYSKLSSIPLQLALDCTETAINNSTFKLPLPTNDIMDLLNLCLTSTYFQYNGKHYRQLHGTAMGSPVSVVVAEIVMQNIEEQALATYKQTVPLWLRYVDDNFTAVHKDEIDIFHEHLNRQNADIQFTREVEDNGKIPFLDCLVSRHDNKLQTTIYRKPTHTDRLLDQSSYNPTSHKATTIRTLTRRAQLVCDSTDSLTDESKYLDNVFSKNNYNPDFVKRNVYKNN